MSNTFLEATDNRGVTSLTRNRPDRHNVFDDTLRRLGDDAGVRAVVLASSDAKHLVFLPQWGAR